MTWTPGTLVRHQPLPRRLWPRSAAHAWRIFYRGYRYDGERRLVSGSAFTPAGEAPEGGWPVIGFAHGTTGLGGDAAPSRTGFPRLERDHVDRWLAAGYAVAATDYEGLATRGPHPYFNGEAVADDVIDAVRALRDLDGDVGGAWLAAGFSQGGHAAMHVANIATGYAPELDLRGTIAIAPAACVKAMVESSGADGRGPLSPITVMTLAGVRVTHPGFDPARHLTPLGAELVERVSRATLKEVFRAVRGVTNDAAGTTGIAAQPDVAEVLDAVSVPATYLDRPVFIAAGSGDEVVPHTAVGRFAEDLRRAGAAVAFTSVDGVDHAGMLAGGQGAAIGFGGEHLAAAAAGPLDVPAVRFDLADRTGDGRLARDDYDAFALRLVRSLGHPPHSPRAAAVRDGYRRLWNAVRTAADADGDGSVSVGEYRAWAAKESAGEGDRGGFGTAIRPLAEAVIALVDGDGDRVLDRAELTGLLTACRLGPDEAEATCRRLDADGDGRVSADEIVAAVRDCCIGGDGPGAWLFGRF
jgi:alpha-beta hydrolase superfamily lysophospholipase